MGASQSTGQPPDEKVFYNETPIQFGQEVVNHLSDHLASPQPSPERQSSLDSHIRSRIQSELSRLREEEENVRHEIEKALEKENLDRERSMAGDGGDGAAGVKSSAVLQGDLEEVRTKIERFHAKRGLDEFPVVKTKGEAVVSCYRSHQNRPLDCWREVSEFKTAVAEVEQHYIDSLR